MVPENRYVLERWKREGGASHPSPPAIGKKTLPVPVIVVSSPPSPQLSQVEKSRDLYLIPMPGGGWRNLDYTGPLEKYLEKIEQNYPFYREAERRTGVNWKI